MITNPNSIVNGELVNLNPSDPGLIYDGYYPNVPSGPLCPLSSVIHHWWFNSEEDSKYPVQVGSWLGGRLCASKRLL